MKKKLKVMFIARNYPPKIGGAEKLNYDLAVNLAKEFNMIVINNKFGNLNPLFYFIAIYRILCTNFDVLLLSDALLSPIILLKYIKRKPVVTKVHGLDIIYDNFLYQLIIKKLLKLSDFVVCISNATKNECYMRGVLRKKSYVIPIGISKSDNEFSLKRRTNGYILLSVGRLVERKGIHWFVKNVVPVLVGKNLKFKYYVIGDGPYKENIKDIITELNLINYVTLLGYQNDHKKFELYSNSDLFIMPNIPVSGDMEGFGIVILEATSHGLPVIASNMEGITDAVIPGITGFLVDPCNIKEYCDVILNVLEDHNNELIDRKEIIQNTLKKYSWDVITRQYRKIILKAYKS